MIDAFERELAMRITAGRAWWFVTAACLNVLGMGIVERRRQRRLRLGPAFSTLDFTLAWRMLLRYPGLSIVGVFGMAVGIMVAAGAFTVIGTLMDAHAAAARRRSHRVAAELGRADQQPRTAVAARLHRVAAVDRARGSRHRAHRASAT